MGTNYYAVTKKKISVECDCGFKHRVPERLHIGKDSYGWYFTLQVIPEKGLFELEDWIPFLRRCDIVDEYERPVSLDEMIGIIRKQDVDLTEEEIRDRMESMKNGGYGPTINFDTKTGLHFMGRVGKDGNYALEEEDFS